MINVTREELIEWHEMVQQKLNFWHMSSQDKLTLARLNHRILEISQAIHNESMMEDK